MKPLRKLRAWLYSVLLPSSTHVAKLAVTQRSWRTHPRPTCNYAVSFIIGRVVKVWKSQRIRILYHTSFDESGWKSFLNILTLTLIHASISGNISRCVWVEMERGFCRQTLMSALNCIRWQQSYLVDPASSHMLVSKIKPCMSKYKQLYTVKLRTAHYISNNLFDGSLLHG